MQRKGELMNCLITCVLKSGGEFKPEHVARLEKQIVIDHLVCLTDMDVDCYKIPLKHNLPGWWSKMELFRPDIKGDILFFDLDTEIVGDISHYTNLDATHVLNDFYWPKRSIGSGMMYIKQKDKKKVWDHFSANFDQIIKENRGDQDYLNRFFFQNAKRWQHEFPNEIFSYKKHVKRHDNHFEGGFDKDNARVICYHGKPRPWAK